MEVRSGGDSCGAGFPDYRPCIHLFSQLTGDGRKMSVECFNASFMPNDNAVSVAAVRTGVNYRSGFRCSNDIPGICTDIHALMIGGTDAAGR